MGKNQELQEQITSLQNENSALKSALADAQRRDNRFALPDNPANVMASIEEKERKRSIVISGIVESKDSKSTERAVHDLDSVKSILNHLDVECIPQVVYRLGKPQADRPRLLKVILPNTFYQSLTLTRASRLRSFPSGGVFIRPSLTKEERERNRKARMARRISRDVSNVSYSQTTEPNVPAVN